MGGFFFLLHNLAMSFAQRMVSMALIVALGIALGTKPSNESFHAYLGEWAVDNISKKQNTSKKSLLDKFQQAVSTIGTMFTPPRFSNFLFFNFVRTMYRGKPYYFVGIFNRWFALGSLDEDALPQLK